MPGVKAIILMGGPSQGMRYKSLSMHTATPLFPLASKPMVHHHLEALAKVNGLDEVLLIGFYQDHELSATVSYLQEDAPFKIRYLPESKGLGTGGGMYYYREEIMRGDPDKILVIHVDVVANFPFDAMIKNFEKLPEGKVVSVMGVKMDAENSIRFGCMAVDASTNEMLHYMEKPDKHISNTINGGVYVFSPKVFEQMEKAITIEQETTLLRNPRRRHSISRYNTPMASANSYRISLEKDVLIPLGGSHKTYVFRYDEGESWTQVKTSENVVQANREILSRYQCEGSPLLTKNSAVDYTVVGNCIVHKTASVDPAAKIGPNAVVGPRVRIYAGARVCNSIVLADALIEENACIINAIVGKNCVVRQWARVQGSYSDKKDEVFFKDGMKLPGIASLGEGVIIDDEIIVRDCIVLPDQHVRASYHNEIL